LVEILCDLNFDSILSSKLIKLYSQNTQEPTGNDGVVTEKTNTPVISQNYEMKIQQELAIYEKQVVVHDLPEIYHYWSNKYLTPLFKDAGFETIAEFFSSNFMEAKNRTGSNIANFVSIGSGNCDLEVTVARNLVDAGFKDFSLQCLELNPTMLARGKELARESDVLSNMDFVEADFNTWEAERIYDGFMANQSLHHVTSLENLFNQVKKSLHARGSFVISDMIGRNGHQRWPESLKIVHKFWKDLPEEYRFNVILNRLEKKYENWDCSKEGFEGIRAQDILPLLLERFECEKFIGFGSAIDIFVDRCFGHNFNPKATWDREFIDKVHASDEAGLKCGALTPTHMLSVFVKDLKVAACHSRGVTPEASIRKP
jgi:SAM-dependent methyltransferase